MVHKIFRILQKKSYFQFEKPGRRDELDYPDMAKESVGKVLKDSNLPYTKKKNEVKEKGKNEAKYSYFY